MSQPKWGPFTGRQLMVMFIALMGAVVLVPGAGYAVDSFSNVAIEDPTTGVKAHLTSGGRVLAQVNDGSGPMTVDGTVALTPDAAVRTTQPPFAATVKVTPASGDPRTCVEVPLPASGKVELKSVMVTDYFSPTVPIAYIKPFVKTGSSTGQVTQLRILLAASEPDPTANVRTGSLESTLVVAGGGFSAAQIGEVYDLYACINHVSGESAQANFIFSGSVVN